MEPHVKKIFSKLPKTELSDHKVELNLQMDIDKFVDEIYEEIDYSERINKDMDAAWVKVRNAVQELSKATQEVKDHVGNLDFRSDAKSLKDKVKAAADAIGVKPDAVKGYDMIDVAVRDASEQAKNARINIRDSKVPKA